MQVRAASGETLDELLWRVLGGTSALDAVLAMNPGLAALGPRLPEGQAVFLPDLPPATQAAARPRETVNLWN